MDKQHFQPRVLDDTFSVEVFENTIDRVDPQGIYFTEEVLDSLGAFRLGLDDELKSGECNFIPQLTQKFQQRLSILEALIDDLSQLKLDFTNTDTISIFGADQFIFAKDDKALKADGNVGLNITPYSRCVISSKQQIPLLVVLAIVWKKPSENKYIKSCLQNPTNIQSSGRSRKLYVSSVFECYC